MNEKPILFNTEMVRAILDDRKTQTRRVLKPQPWDHGSLNGPEWFEPVAYDKNGDEYPGEPIFGIYDDHGEFGAKCPYGAPGTRLWVRETWGAETEYGGIKPSELPEGIKVYYRTDGDGQSGLDKWRPSIFMPRWASRLTLEVTGVRVERVQNISREDAIAEGLRSFWANHSIRTNKMQFWQCGLSDAGGYPNPIEAFENLWDSINKKRGYGWEKNPWVWVIEFNKRLEK